MPLYLEDFQVGTVRQTGSWTVTRDEIVAFARQFDPQPFHLDEEAARRSPYGGLIASGWHTSALCMRLVVDSFLKDGVGSLGSPGVDELRWLQPVRPGDTLTVQIEVVAIVPSKSRPDRGVVRLRYTVRNQKEEDVMTVLAMGLMLKRPEG
ncbi:MAG TPA: MaoC family dehydratase [Thermoanaerobaculia bacterium]|nr:MaoC family dehydratase [Thermoanaerobaculia bacterium]